MSRFLLIPKGEDIPHAIGGDRPSLAPEARARRIERLAAFRGSARRTMRGDNLARIADVKVIASPQRQMPMTGITVFEGSLEDAHKVQQAFPEQELVEDFALDLIAPVPVRAERGRRGSASLAPSGLDRWHLDAIGLLKARAAGFGLIGAGATVAVMDTGVAEHEELRGRIVDNIVLDIEAWRASSAAPADTDTIHRGHGTHVAGLIAGTEVGVAPGAKILSYTMLPNTFGSLSHYLLSMEHALARPEIQIFNVSAGRKGQDDWMRRHAKMAQSLGILLVVAVGNEGSGTSRSPGSYPEVLSVGASERMGGAHARSGMESVPWDGTPRVAPDIVAPGVKVRSLLPGEGYQLLTGTSQAAPIVSGIAALMIERWPSITRPELVGELLASVDALGLPAPFEAIGRVQLPDRLIQPPPTGADAVA